LEINPNHPLIKSLLEKVQSAKSTDPEASVSNELIDLMHILTHSALIHSGYSLENPHDF
jgi:HSP90 family molecular chaperone